MIWQQRSGVLRESCELKLIAFTHPSVDERLGLFDDVACVALRCNRAIRRNNAKAARMVAPPSRVFLT